MLRTARVAAALVGGYAFVLSVEYVLGLRGTQRHHIESALFIAAALWMVCLIGASSDNGTKTEGVSFWVVVIMGVVSSALYSRAITVGFLSDDYVLREWALQHKFLGTGWPFARPVALGGWSLILGLGGGATTLHLLNIILHGVNTALVATLAVHIGLGRSGALVSGAAFAIWPTHVEPVVWAAGVFDVMMTTFVLSTILLYLRAAQLHNVRLLAGTLALLVAALLTKEAAVSVPALIMIIRAPSWKKSGFSQSERWALGLVIGITMCYLAWRLLVHLPISPTPRLTRYVFKEHLSRVFGSLAIPFTTWTVRAYPEVPIFATAMTLVIAGIATVASSKKNVVVQGLVWCLVASLPAFGTLFVGLQLQGSRFLYLPCVGWALFLGAVFDSANRRVVRGMLGVMLATLFVLTSLQQQRLISSWLAASGVRDSLLQDAVREALESGCSRVNAERLPGELDGAQLFTNGFAQAYEGVKPSIAGDATCLLTWDGAHLRKKQR